MSRQPLDRARALHPDMIAELCDNRTTSIETLAFLAGVDEKTIDRWLDGKRGYIKNLSRLASRLKRTLKLADGGCIHPQPTQDENTDATRRRQARENDGGPTSLDAPLYSPPPELMNTQITEIGLSQRVVTLLHGEGIRAVRDLLLLSAKEILESRWLGESSMKEIRRVFTKLRFDFSAAVSAIRQNPGA